MAYNYYDYDPAMEPYPEEEPSTDFRDTDFRDVNGQPIREGDLVRAVTQNGGIVRGKVFVEHDHGAQVWRVQSSSSIGWRPFLAQCKRVELL